MTSTVTLSPLQSVSIESIFAADPRELSDDQLRSLILELRRRRSEHLAAEAAKLAKGKSAKPPRPPSTTTLVAAALDKPNAELDLGGFAGMIKELLFPEVSSRYTALVASGVPPSRAYSIAFDQAIAQSRSPDMPTSSLAEKAHYTQCKLANRAERERIASIRAYNRKMGTIPLPIHPSNFINFPCHTSGSAIGPIISPADSPRRVAVLKAKYVKRQLSLQP